MTIRGIWIRYSKPDTAWYCRGCGREYTLGHESTCPFRNRPDA